VKPKIREIRDELLEAYIDLEKSYMESPETTTDPEKRIMYLEIQMVESLLNSMKALEYHYRDDIPEMRTKKKWNDQMKRVHKLLKKYSELSEPSNPYSNLQLQEKFDETGYISHRKYIEDLKTQRVELKRKK
jgi:hypothetical protein